MKTTGVQWADWQSVTRRKVSSHLQDVTVDAHILLLVLSYTVFIVQICREEYIYGVDC